MKTAPSLFRLCLLVAGLLPIAVQAQLTYTTNSGSITITGYTGNPTALTIPTSINGYPVTKIGNNAFFQSTLTSLTLPNTLTNIGTGAFGYCASLTSVKIPSSVNTIGLSAFASCSSLSSLTISNGVATLKSSAFSGTSLTSVTIPGSVTSIEPQVFSLCSLLTTITVDSFNPTYSSLNGILYNQDQTALLEYPPGKAGAFTVPNTVASIANYGFYACQTLTSVTLSNSVTSIGSSAFVACIALTNVILSGTITNLGDMAFYNCLKLPRVAIPSSVINIGNSTFSGCTNLSSVIFSNGVTTLGNSAFASCAKLTSIFIPASITDIGNNVFQSSSNITSIYFTGNAPNIGTNIFGGDNKATVYYLPGTTGWTATFGGRPAVLWDPQFEVSDTSFGIQTNRFGFLVTGMTNIPILLEACTNVTTPAWIPLQSCTLTNGALYLSDRQWTNYPNRFYRLRSP